jgi:PPOX class probable F420-dependent enzyme
MGRNRPTGPSVTVVDGRPAVGFAATLPACGVTVSSRTVVDESSEFGTRVARHLREDKVVWLTTVSRSGGPLPSPVWFLWDSGESVLVYSMESARVRNVASNSNVSLNFDGDRRGGDIVVLSGTAVEEPEAPPADANADYLTKYGAMIEEIGYTPTSFAEEYCVPLRVQIRRVRGH